MSMKLYRILSMAVLTLGWLSLAGCNLPVKDTPAVSQPTALVTILPGPISQTSIPKQPDQPIQTTTATPKLPTATPLVFQTATVTPRPLDRKDPGAVIAAIRQALEKKDLGPFSLLAAEKPAYVNYIEGGQPVDKAKLLGDLQARLAGSSLVCDGYATYENTLQVWTSGWKPDWQMDKLCYQDCQTLNPPYRSQKAAFFLSPNKSGEYELTGVWLNDAKLWNEIYKLQMHACGEPYLPPPATINCPGAPEPRLNVNGYAYASTQSTTANRVRSLAGISANIVGLLEAGKAVQITGGPACANGYIWWQVKALEGNLRLDGRRPGQRLLADPLRRPRHLQAAVGGLAVEILPQRHRGTEKTFISLKCFLCVSVSLW